MIMIAIIRGWDLSQDIKNAIVYVRQFDLWTGQIIAGQPMFENNVHNQMECH
jgi:hypothetical protein